MKCEISSRPARLNYFWSEIKNCHFSPDEMNYLQRWLKSGAESLLTRNHDRGIKKVPKYNQLSEWWFNSFQRKLLVGWCRMQNKAKGNKVMKLIIIGRFFEAEDRLNYGKWRSIKAQSYRADEDIKLNISETFKILLKIWDSIRETKTIFAYEHIRASWRQLKQVIN